MNGSLALVRRSAFNLFLVSVLVFAAGCPDDEPGQGSSDTRDAGSSDELDLSVDTGTVT